MPVLPVGLWFSRRGRARFAKRAVSVHYDRSTGKPCCVGSLHLDQGFGTALGLASAVGSASFGVAMRCLSSTANSMLLLKLPHLYFYRSRNIQILGPDTQSTRVSPICLQPGSQLPNQHSRRQQPGANHDHNQGKLHTLEARSLGLALP
jgi:hypothetical protein